MSHIGSLIERLRATSRRIRIRKRIRERIRRRSQKRTVAIACQGGGSHAAFTAGALGTLLADLSEEYRLVGLSGTSGGAVSATAGWYGYLAPGTTPGSVLEALWDDIAASPGWEAWVNELTLMKTRVPGGGTMAGGSPYSNPASGMGRHRLETILTDHVDFDAFRTLATEQPAPAILVSAVNVHTGDPAVFRDDDVTVEAVVASAAVPHLFEAVEIGDAYFWDGFLAQNPPIWELLVDETIPPVDELWIIQLTPQVVEDLPTSEDEIYDRTQQLVENLSLTQERRFVEAVNERIAGGKLSDAGLTETTIRTIQLHREQTDTSRLNRRSSFIDDLYADGEAEAINFLRDLDEP